MKPVLELLEHQELHCVGQDETVLEVVRRMVAWKVGAVTVLDGLRLVGIFSERDLMTRVVSPGVALGTTPVGRVMTPNPVVVDAHSTVEQCLRIMQQANCRHLPVLSGGNLVGIISMRDLLLSDLREKDDEIEMMRAYIHYVPSSPPTSPSD